MAIILFMFNLYKSILILIFLTFSSMASQIATVKVDKAVVYSDLSLSTPIGYVKRGKKLLVGDIKRNKDRILPIVISGKIAYIKTEDILLKEVLESEHEKRVREHDIEQVNIRKVDKLNENNYLALSFGKFSLGQEWSDLSNASNDTTNAATTISLMIQHRPIKSPTSWGFGLTYAKNTQEVLQSEFLTIDMNIYRDFFKTRYISMQTLFGLSFSGDNRITTLYSDGETVLSRGSLAGIQAGAQLRLFPHSKIGYIAGITYRYYKVFSQNPILIPNSSDFLEITNQSGVNIFAGISYAL